MQTSTTKIQVTDLDGRNQRTLATNEGYADLMDWPPDGKHLLYLSNRDLFVTKSDGSGKRKLTDGKCRVLTAQFTNDGAKVLYSAVGDGSSDLFSVDIDGITTRNLTSSPASETEPDYSPH